MQFRFQQLNNNFNCFPALYKFLNLLNFEADGKDTKLFLEHLHHLRLTQSINILRKLVSSILWFGMKIKLIYLLILI